MKMRSQGRVHESEQRGQRETARRGERNITANPRTNEGRSTTSEGIIKAPIKVVQTTSFMGKENKNLTLTQNLVTRLV